MKSSVREWLHALVWAYRHIFGKTRIHELKAVEKFINEADTVVDIGAHAGAWTFKLSKICSKGTVVAIEALPYYASVLAKCRLLMRCENTKIINKAIVAESKNVKVVWADSTGKRLTGFTHVAGPNEFDGKMVDVKGQALDEILKECEGRISFIKCDVEGGEVGVLLGSSGTIIRWRPVVFMEVNSKLINRYNESVEFVFSFFEKYKYTACYIDQAGRIIKIPSIKEFVGNDVLFVPDEVAINE